MREEKVEKDSSRVTSKGQVVIPKKLREKYDIVPAITIRWIPKKEGLLMVPETGDVIKAARGMLKGSNLLKAYLKEKKLEKQRENKKIGRRG
jgi:bifunctional DNA-binding transcriptional regulator/antitoxin component of YhaV-PrlF toxin-antitoxin module